MNLRSALLTTLLLTQPPAQAAPYTLNANGQEVTDQATGLVWRRCAEGMNWDGTTCAGTATTFTHENALVRARTEAVASGKAWRLPNVRELSSLADRTRYPAIDVAAFPATALFNSFWSASPYVGVPSYAWHIIFGAGDIVYNLRDEYHLVRLVRASQ